MSNYPNKLNLSIKEKFHFVRDIQAYFNSGNYEKARFEVEYSLKEKAADLTLEVRSQLYYIKSLCNVLNNKKEDAIIDISMAIIFNPGFADYYHVRSELLKEMNHTLQGVIDLEIYLEMSLDMLRGNIEARRVIDQIDEQLDQIVKLKTQLKSELLDQKLDSSTSKLYNFLNATRKDDIKRRLEGLKEFMV